MSKPEPEDGTTQDIEAMAKSRQWFHKEAEKRALHGDVLCASLLDIERLASPFFLGLDYDEDEGDFECMEAL